MSYIFRGPLSVEMNEYLELLKNAGRNVTCYDSTFRSLDKYMVEHCVSQKALGKHLVCDWLKTLSVADATKKYTIGRIRRFARYLTALGIPAYEPEFCRVSSNYIVYTFSDDEFSAIIDAADNYKGTVLDSDVAYMFPILLRILYCCGLRVGEAITLCWKDIDLEAGIINIMKGKNNKQRRVPMSSSLTELLRQYYDRRLMDGESVDFLFGNKKNNGKPFITWTFRYWFQRILDAAGITNQRSIRYERGISPHTLRHYFTFKSFQNLELQGYSLEEIAPYLSAYLGHGSFCGTEKYISTDYMLYLKSHQQTSRIIDSVLPEVVFE